MSPAVRRVGGLQTGVEIQPVGMAARDLKLSQIFLKRFLKIVMNARPLILSIVLATAGCLTANFVSAQEAKSPPKITFDDHVKPIFLQRCSSCHSSNKKEADLDLTNYTALMMGGGSGEVISPGAASDSYLYLLVTHEESPEMPPSGTKIPEPEIKMIADWINLGALENAGSKPRKAKPKLDMALGESATTRPEVVPVPMRMPLEPVIKTDRPSATSMATSPWAPLAAIASPKQILLYDTQTLELTGLLPMEEGIAHTLRFSRNGSLLLAGGGRDGQLGKTIIWDVKTGDRVATVGEELDAVLAADISSSHQLVALGGPNKLVKIFAVGEEQPRFELKKHTDWVTAMEFSPDGKFLASGDRNGGLHVWEVETGSEIYALKGHTAAINGLSWRADSKILASASEDTTVRTWEMDKGTQIKSWGAHGGGVTAIEFVRDGRIATAGRDKVAKLWDQNGAVQKQFGGLPDVAVAVSYCDETNRMLAADWTGQINVWNAADAALVGNLAANPPTIAERIAAAESAFAAAKEKFDPLAAKAQQVKTQLDQLAADLAATKQTKAEMEIKVAETEKQLTATKQQFESTSSQHSQWQQELMTNNTAKPLLEQTYTSAVEAAKVLPEDGELKQTIALLETKKNGVAAKAAELASLVEKSNQQKETTKTQMDQLTVNLTNERKTMEAMVAQVVQLESQLAEVTKQVEAETQVVQAAQAELDQARQEVDKWKGHLAFIEQLTALQGQLSQTEQTVEERLAAVEAANEKLAAAKAVLEQAQAAKQEQENQANSLRDQILQLQGGK